MANTEQPIEMTLAETIEEDRQKNASASRQAHRRLKEGVEALAILLTEEGEVEQGEWDYAMAQITYGIVARDLAAFSHLASLQHEYRERIRLAGRCTK